MPTLNINGQTVNVGPEFLKLSPEQQDATVDEIAQHLSGASKNKLMFDDLPAGPLKFDDLPKGQAQPSVLGDVAKSAGVGLAGGVLGLAGLPADVLNLGAKGIDALISSKPTLAPYTQRVADYAGGNALQGYVEKATGPFYQPQTTAGQYARTIGEFAPALFGGPETLGTKLATRVALPAIASETAGQLTQGTDFEPYARAGAAVLGGAAGARITTRAAERAAAKAGPTNAEIGTNAGNTYDTLTAQNIGVPVSNTELRDIGTDIRDTLNKKGIRPSTAGAIHAAVNEIETPATANLGDVADLVAARQNIKSLLGSPDANKAGAAVALPIIERNIEQLSPGTMAAIRSADQDYSIYKAGQAIDKKMYRAELRNAGDHSGLNLGNKIRQKITDYLVSSDSRYLSAENRKILEGVVHASNPENALRAVSNLLGGGGGLGTTGLALLAGFGAGEYSGHPELAALPLLGVGIRSASNRAIVRRAERAAQEMRNNSNLGQAMLASRPPLPQGISAPRAALLNAALSLPAISQRQPQQP